MLIYYECKKPVDMLVNVEIPKDNIDGVRLIENATSFMIDYCDDVVVRVSTYPFEHLIELKPI